MSRRNTCLLKLNILLSQGEGSEQSFFIRQMSAVFYPWSAPVEFRKDSPTQGIYSLQHFRSEFWELRSLADKKNYIIWTPHVS